MHLKGSKSETEKRENPTIGEVISINEEISTVWDRFQYGISKEEMYPDQSATITEVVDTMRQLPVVGKDICYALQYNQVPTIQEYLRRREEHS